MKVLKKLKSRIFVAFVAAALGVAPSIAGPCTPTPGEPVRIALVRDGRTLVLADGRELRLAGIESAGQIGALRHLTEGRTVGLQPGLSTDRYGRLVGFAALPGAGLSIQETLLAQGAARVSSRPPAKPCADALLAAERAARAARLGLWADPNFAPLSSDNLTRLAAMRGQFALVEGKVLSVRESGATVYVNFGRRWTRDFTVTIPKREQRAFAAAGLEPKALEGRRIRARGFLEQRGGPIVDATAPEQIELID